MDILEDGKTVQQCRVHQLTFAWWWLITLRWSKSGWRDWWCFNLSPQLGLSLTLDRTGMNGDRLQDGVQNIEITLSLVFVTLSLDYCYYPPALRDKQMRMWQEMGYTVVDKKGRPVDEQA